MMKFFNKHFFSTHSSLKHLLQKEIVPERRQKFARLRKQHGEQIVGQIRVNDAILGMRGLKAMFYDGSNLDSNLGITFRGHVIPDFCRNAQRAPNGQEPLPEVMFFLLLTGRYPSDTEVKQLSEEWKKRGELSKSQKHFIFELPINMHPMTMLPLSILNLQNHSKFYKAYQKGVGKLKLWQYYYEDAMDLIAKLPHICAFIYRHKYRNSQIIESDPNLDWAGNFAHMLGYDDHQFMQSLRAYLSVHADHEGGNVSAHTYHLVGSALADPYLSYSAAMCGLAGPLHGLANQQCLKWLNELKAYHKGEQPNKKLIEQFVNKTLAEGRVIPGYGHAVLRKTDPRFLHLKNFADKHIKNDYIADLARACFETIPGILEKVGKIKNPYPNVDAFSGVVVNYYGIKETDFYTTIFAVSRAIGCLTNGVWSRALGLPIERPNSIDMNYITKLQ